MDYEKPDPTNPIMRYVDTLEPGEMYEVYHFKQTKAGGRPELCLLAYYMDEGINFFSFLPKKYADMPSSKFADLMSQIENKKNPKICFYGKLGIANLVEIHKFDEPVNGKLLSKVEKLQTSMNRNRTNSPRTPQKGRSDGGEPSTPKRRGDDSYYETTPKKKKGEDNEEIDGDLEGTPNKKGD